MVKRGIHPLVNTMTLVLRNGATIQVQSILKAARPMRLQIVRTYPPMLVFLVWHTSEMSRHSAVRKSQNSGAYLCRTQRRTRRGQERRR